MGPSLIGSHSLVRPVGSEPTVEVFRDGRFEFPETNQFASTLKKIFNFGDNNMRSFFSVALSLSLFCFASDANAQFVEYDPATGNVTFQELNNVGGIRLVGPGVPVVDPDGLGGFPDTSIANEVSWLFFTAKNGELDMGNLFPTGLWVHEIEADYSAFFVITGGGGAQEPAPILGGIIPEPSTMLMAGMGMLGLVLRRRRLV